MTFKATVIATTYNQSVDLDLYLHSLRSQTDDAFEILIADDGSGEETAEVIRRHQTEFFGDDRLRRVWHADVGYRKAKILNRAVHSARTDWLVFTDSDLVLHPQFIADHLRYRAPNRIFMGRRVDLGEGVSGWIRSHRERLFSPEFYRRILRSGFEEKGPTTGYRRSIRIASDSLARMIGAFRVPDLLGSNFSIDRDLLFRVNGFDEAREHYWGEDGDLFVRVRNSGAEIIGRKNFAVQFHLWHARRQPKPDAEVEYAQALLDVAYRTCPVGLAQTER
jgi:glycosyltransferase involved in cell wall biosynthesis